MLTYTYNVKLLFRNKAIKCNYFICRTFLCYVLVPSCGSSHHTAFWLFRRSTLTYESVADLSKDQYISTLAFFNSLKWMETDAKLSLCKHKQFWKLRGKELFSVKFPQLNNLPPWHRTLEKYIMPLRDSFLMSLSSAATQLPNSPPVGESRPLTNG